MMKFFLLTVIIGLGSSLSIDDCPSGLKRDKYLKVFGQRCFRFNTNGWLDFYDAHEYCTKGNGFLAMPKTKAINDFLSKQLSQLHVTKDSWIGLNDKEKEDYYYWEDNTPMTWDNFVPGEGPDHWAWVKDWEDCIAMSTNGVWRDHHCDTEFFGLINERKPFICEYQAGQSSGTPSTTPASTSCPIIECDLDCGMLGFKTNAAGCSECKCNT